MKKLILTLATLLILALPQVAEASISVYDAQGKMILLSPAAEVIDGVTVVPIRTFSEYFGAEIIWNSGEIQFIKGNTTITININSTEAIIEENGVSTSEILPLAPYLEDGITLIPLRFIAENLGEKVTYQKLVQDDSDSEAGFYQIYYPLLRDLIIIGDWEDSILTTDEWEEILAENGLSKNITHLNDANATDEITAISKQIYEVLGAARLNLIYSEQYVEEVTKWSSLLYDLYISDDILTSEGYLDYLAVSQFTGGEGGVEILAMSEQDGKIYLDLKMEILPQIGNGPYYFTIELTPKSLDWLTTSNLADYVANIEDEYILYRYNSLIESCEDYLYEITGFSNVRSYINEPTAWLFEDSKGVI